MTRGAVVSVRVTPRAGRDAVDGISDAGELQVRVAAAPADGAANKSVCRLLASRLGVPRGAVTVAGGVTSRHKRVAVDGVGADTVRRAWPGVSARDA
mgnify:CR=1 FL=1